MVLSSRSTLRNNEGPDSGQLDGLSYDICRRAVFVECFDPLKSGFLIHFHSLFDAQMLSHGFVSRASDHGHWVDRGIAPSNSQTVWIAAWYVSSVMVQRWRSGRLRDPRGCLVHKKYELNTAHPEQKKSNPARSSSTSIVNVQTLVNREQKRQCDKPLPHAERGERTHVFLSLNGFDAHVTNS